MTYHNVSSGGIQHKTNHFGTVPPISGQLATMLIYRGIGSTNIYSQGGGGVGVGEDWSMLPQKVLKLDALRPSEQRAFQL